MNNQITFDMKKELDKNQALFFIDFINKIKLFKINDSLTITF